MTNSPDANQAYIGIDLSGATLRSALVRHDGELLKRDEIPMQPDTLTHQIAEAVNNLRAQATTAPIAALGVGVPGLINPRTRRVEISADHSTLTARDLRAEIESLTNLPTTLANDANAAAFAEYTAGSGRGSGSMFYALIGKGIGGALILDGRLWTGASGYAGEFGYIAVDAEGTVLEQVASAPNIVRRTQERLFRDGTSSLSRLAMNPAFKAADIAREAANGDDFALLMIERTGHYIGTAVASVINLLNIERIVLGGGIISEAGDLIIEPITREAAKRSFRPCFEATSIAAAALGADAVTIGAAMLARDAAHHSPTQQQAQ